MATMTNRPVRAGIGVFLIAAGLFAVILETLAFMNLFGTAGPITIFGVIGGICAITTGVRLVRQAIRVEDAAPAERPQPLS